MTHPRKRRRSKHRKHHVAVPSTVGVSPGTISIHPAAAGPTRIRIMGYGPEGLVENDDANIAKIQDCMHRHAITWICVEGLGDELLLQQLGGIFGLHTLAIEDVASLRSRPKVEFYEDHIFAVAREIKRDECLHSEQVNVFWGKGFVLTLHKSASEILDPLRARIRAGAGRHRSRGSDYLAYTILDVIIDGFFVALEDIGCGLDEAEVDVFDKSDPTVMETLHTIRHELLVARRAIRPMREVLNRLQRDPTPFMTEETKVYLRDCYDHVMESVELLEVYHDLSSSLIEAYMTRLSNVTNDIMRVLTLITSVFIPLSFIAGLYGMNFSNPDSPYAMPELHWRYGYPIVLVLMFVIAIAMVLFFWRKGWLQNTTGNLHQPRIYDDEL